MKNLMAKYIKLPVVVKQYGTATGIEVVDDDGCCIAVCAHWGPDNFRLERAEWIVRALNELGESKAALDFAAKVIERQSQEQVRLIIACQDVLAALELAGEQGRVFADEILRLKKALLSVGSTPGAAVTEVKR